MTARCPAFEECHTCITLRISIGPSFQQPTRTMIGLTPHLQFLDYGIHSLTEMDKRLATCSRSRIFEKVNTQSVVSINTSVLLLSDIYLHLCRLLVSASLTGHHPQSSQAPFWVNKKLSLRTMVVNRRAFKFTSSDLSRFRMESTECLTASLSFCRAVFHRDTLASRLPEVFEVLAALNEAREKSPVRGLFCWRTKDVSPRECKKKGNNRVRLAYSGTRAFILTRSFNHS